MMEGIWDQMVMMVIWDSGSNIGGMEMVGMLERVRILETDNRGWESKIFPAYKIWENHF